MDSYSTEKSSQNVNVDTDGNKIKKYIIKGNDT